MITNIKINNFKSHLATNLKVSPLTILTGVNGMGKSSLIQSLLLLRQSVLKDAMGGLMLNGDLCKIGTALDAITVSAKEDAINFDLEFDKDLNINFSYKINNQKLDDDLLEITNQIGTILKDNIPTLSIFNNNFQYISAYRNTIPDKIDNIIYHVDQRNQISGIEGRAEYVAPYIFKHSDKDITLSSLKHPDSSSLNFKTQIEYWLREFSPNINLHVEKVADNSFKTEFSFNRDNGRPTIRFNVKNVGFGLSYDLPLLAVILNSKPGDLIIIENPESHIHPRGQAVLIELICKAAASGVQFIIETHSDHIINGALVAIKKKNIYPQNISMYYFSRNEENHSTVAIPIDISDSGKIHKAPSGFFDQISIDMRFLMGF